MSPVKTCLSPARNLVWAKLLANVPISEGSAVLVEPAKSHSGKNVVIGRVVASMSSDGWVPVKVLNTSDKPVTLWRNAKLADVSPCIALEDLDLSPQLPPSHELVTFGMDDNAMSSDSRSPNRLDSLCPQHRGMQSVLVLERKACAVDLQV